MSRIRPFLVVWGLSVAAACSAAAGRAAPAPAAPMAAAPAAPESSPILLDEVVATVQGRPITLSEVEAEIRISFAVRGRIEAAMGPISLEMKAAALPELIDRAAILRTLRSHYTNVLDPHADERDLRQLRSQFPSDELWEKFLAKLDLTQDELRERRRRALDAGKILEAKVADTARVDRATVDEFMQMNPNVTDRATAEMLVAHELTQANRDKILQDARHATGVRIIDPLVQGSAGSAAAGGTR